MAEREAKTLERDTGSESIALRQSQRRHIAMAIRGAEMNSAALLARPDVNREWVFALDRGFDPVRRLAGVVARKKLPHRHTRRIAELFEAVAPGDAQRFPARGDSLWRCRGPGPLQRF